MRGCIAGLSALKIWRSENLPSITVKSLRQDVPNEAPKLSKAEGSYLQQRFNLQIPLHMATVSKVNRRNNSQITSTVDLPTRRRSCLRLSENAFLSSPEDTALDVVGFLACQQYLNSVEWQSKASRRHAASIAGMVLLTEMMGRYAFSRTSCDGLKKKEVETLTLSTLHAFLNYANGVKGAASFMEAASFALAGCESPAETALLAFMCLPKSWGGAGLPLPQANKKVVVDAINGAAQRRTDFCWEDQGLVVEYNGSYHEGERANSDDRRRNQLLDKGYSTITVNSEQLFHPGILQSEVLSPLERRLGSHGRRMSDYQSRQRDLRALVFELNGTLCAENIGKYLPPDAHPY